MSNVNNPDVTDEDIGRRTVEIRRERAVERAIERLRKGCGPAWQQLTTRDVERLHWALGELWTFLPHAEWEDLRFTSQGQAGVTKLLALGAELAESHTTTNELEAMAAQLRPSS